MSATKNVMELVERKLEILDVEDRVAHMPQSTEDFFTRDDRKELFRQTVQAEQILRDLGEIKVTAKENARNALEATEAHEKRIRALEDDRLTLRTQMQTSWRWVVLASAVVGGLANFLIKLVWK
jgi:predicted  nucleic acid-binding Zn-ribbon protein